MGNLILGRHLSAPSFYKAFVLYQDGVLLGVKTLGSTTSTSDLIYDPNAPANSGPDYAGFAFISCSSDTQLTGAALVSDDDIRGSSAVHTDMLNPEMLEQYNLNGANYFFSFARFMFRDLLNPNVIWIASDATRSGQHKRIVIFTIDGGINWTEIQLDNVTGGTLPFSDTILPLHDGQNAYAMFSEAVGSYPTYSYNHFVYKININGTYSSKNFGSIVPSGTSVGPMFRGSIRIGNTDDMYYSTYNSCEIYRLRWSDTSNSLVFSDPNDSGIAKQVMTTRAGTILYLAANNTVGNKMYIHRSTDGLTWSNGVGTFYLPHGEYFASADRYAFDYDTWDFISEASDGTLFIAFEDGTGIFSVDDGQTWTKTNQFLTYYNYRNQVYDSEGVGPAG